MEMLSITLSLRLAGLWQVATGPALAGLPPDGGPAGTASVDGLRARAPAPQKARVLPRQCAQPRGRKRDQVSEGPGVKSF